jgi:hypothetical protein
LTTLLLLLLLLLLLVTLLLPPLLLLVVVLPLPLLVLAVCNVLSTSLTCLGPRVWRESAGESALTVPVLLISYQHQQP